MRRIADAAAAMRLDREATHRYPSVSTWRDLTPDETLNRHVLAAFDTSRRGVLAIAGPSQSGKTFHLLHLGFWWEARKPGSLAFYAPRASELTVEAVVELWRATMDRSCLWLVDEVDGADHETLALLVDQFEELASPSHWLVTAGWSTGNIDRIPEANVEVLTWPRTPFLVAETLRTSGHGALVTDERVERLAKSRLGLRDMLNAARHDPIVLDRPNDFDDRWLAAAREHLPECSEAMLPRLARLRFLSQGFRPRITADVDCIREIRGSVAQILRGAEADTERWYLEEDFAQLYLRSELAHASDVAAEFAQGLMSHLSSMVQDRRLGEAADLLGSVGARSAQDLCGWLRLPEHTAGTRSDSIIAHLVDDSVLTRLRTAMLSEVDGKGVDSIITCRRLLEALDSREDWVKATAVEIWGRLGDDALLAWASSDIASWEAAAVLARSIRRLEAGVLQGRVKPGALMGRAAVSEPIRSQFSSVPSGQRRLLSLAEGLGDRSAYDGFLSMFRDRLESGIDAVSPKRAWQRLLLLGHPEPNAAIELLLKQKVGRFRDLLFKAPAMARHFKTMIDRGKDAESTVRRQRLNRAFTEIFKKNRVGDEDVVAWANYYDLIAIIAIAARSEGGIKAIDTQPVRELATELVRHGNGAALKGLGRAVARHARGTELHASVLEAFTDSGHLPHVIERMEAINALGPWAISERWLSGVIAAHWRDMEPLDGFWFLWNVVNRYPDVGAQLAEGVSEERWRTIAESPRTAIAMHGVCLYASKADYLGTARLGLFSEILPPDEEMPAPKSPPMTACQLLGFSQLANAAQDNAYAHALWLIRHLTNPGAEYRRQWHNLAPQARRVNLGILHDALELMIEKAFLDLASRLAWGASSDTNDEIWDDHMLLRLKAASLGCGHGRAQALVERRCDAWAQRMKKMQPDPLFIRLVHEVTREASDAARDCAAKLSRVWDAS